MGRVLGLDYGKRRVGAAISDPGRSIASPLEVFELRDPVQNARHYRSLIEEHEIEQIVVGLPIHTTGRVSELAQAARVWGDWLTGVTGLPVFYYDERYSSAEADNQLRETGFNWKKRKGFRDMLAARTILQNYLDAGCPTEESPLLPLLDSELGEDGQEADGRNP